MDPEGEGIKIVRYVLKCSSVDTE